MKTIIRFFRGLAMAIAGLATALFGHIRNKAQGMLNRVSDEGYETAYDVLYPKDEIPDNLHYGPVIPE